MTRKRSKKDERVTLVSLTEEGRNLHDRAMEVPTCMVNDLDVDPKLASELAALLDRFMEQVVND